MDKIDSINKKYPFAFVSKIFDVDNFYGSYWSYLEWHRKERTLSRHDIILHELNTTIENDEFELNSIRSYYEITNSVSFQKLSDEQKKSFIDTLLLNFEEIEKYSKDYNRFVRGKQGYLDSGNEYKLFNSYFNKPISKVDVKKKSKNRITTNQQLLILYYLDILKSNGSFSKNEDIKYNNTKKSEILSYILGQDKHNIRKTFSDLENKLKTKNNLEVVKRIFEDIKVPELVEIIDSDIKKLGNK